MTISEYDIIKRLTGKDGGIVVPVHLAGREFNNVEEAGTAFASHLEEQRTHIWSAATVIAAADCQAIGANKDEASIRKITADSLRHFAGLFGDRDIETIRRWLKIGLVFPETTADGEIVRDMSRPVNLYLSALGAMAYDDDPVMWVVRAIDNDWPVHELTQRIKAAHIDGPLRIVSVRNLFDYTIPAPQNGGVSVGTIIEQLAEIVYAAFHSPYMTADGEVEEIIVKVAVKRSKRNGVSTTTEAAATAAQAVPEGA